MGQASGPRSPAQMPRLPWNPNSRNYTCYPVTSMLKMTNLKEWAITEHVYSSGRAVAGDFDRESPIAGF